MFENRIKGHGTEKPDQLLANPDNWRVHPRRQQEALEQALGKVGWVQSILVNTTTGHVVDGHLRVALAISRDEEEIPVTYVELSEDEEKLVLASLDPLSTMAIADTSQLLATLSAVDVEGELEALLRRTAGIKDDGTDLPSQAEIDRRQDELSSAFSGGADLIEVECPECHFQFALNRRET